MTGYTYRAARVSHALLDEIVAAGLPAPYYCSTLGDHVSLVFPAWLTVDEELRLAGVVAVHAPAETTTETIVRECFAELGVA